VTLLGQSGLGSPRAGAHVDLSVAADRGGAPPQGARPHASSGAGRHAARARARCRRRGVVTQFSSMASELPGYQDNLKHKIDDLQSVSRGGVLEKIQETLAGSRTWCLRILFWDLSQAVCVV